MSYSGAWEPQPPAPQNCFLSFRSAPFPTATFPRASPHAGPGGRRTFGAGARAGAGAGAGAGGWGWGLGLGAGASVDGPKHKSWRGDYSLRLSESHSPPSDSPWGCTKSGPSLRCREKKTKTSRQCNCSSQKAPEADFLARGHMRRPRKLPETLPDSSRMHPGAPLRTWNSPNQADSSSTR